MTPYLRSVVVALALAACSDATEPVTIIEPVPRILDSLQLQGSYRLHAVNGVLIESATSARQSRLAYVALCDLQGADSTDIGTGGEASLSGSSFLVHYTEHSFCASIGVLVTSRQDLDGSYSIQQISRDSATIVFSNAAGSRTNILAGTIKPNPDSFSILTSGDTLLQGGWLLLKIREDNVQFNWTREFDLIFSDGSISAHDSPPW